MVLLIVVALWGIVLGPIVWQARTEARKNRSVEIFRRRLARLAPPEPLVSRPAGATRPAGSALPTGASLVRIAPALPPAAAASTRPVRPRSVVLRRHRRLLAVLLGAMAVTLVLGVLPPLRWLWGTHVVLDAGFVSYAAALRYRQLMIVERAAKVRYLPPPEPAQAPAPEGAVAVRQTASS